MAATPSVMIPLGTTAPDFALPDYHEKETDDAIVQRTDFTGRPLLVMFICNHCPFVIHVRDELKSIAADYGDRVAIVGINSNDAVKYPDDAPRKMPAEGYPFPYLFDLTQDVAKAYSAACTPDLFLFDADHKLAYRGQLDDSRPSNGRPVTGADLRAALDAVLAGNAPDEDQTPSIGCNIKWKPGNEPDAD